jgi:hypothetical protein
MKTSETPRNDGARLTRVLRVCAAALAVTLPAVLPQAGHADAVTPPAVPAAIEVPTGNTAFLQGHAVGTQGYICQPSGASFAWTFVKPQATLFDANNEQIITHFLSANPDESGMPRASWQHSQDTSHVWGNKIASADHTSDPTIVAADAIPWFLLQVVGKKPGPTGGDTLTASTYIQRLNTSGGVAPATGCAQSTDVGNKALVPYTADYFFYKAS